MNNQYVHPILIENSIVTWIVINCIILSIWAITFLCYCCFPSSKGICPEGTTQVILPGKCDDSFCIKVGDSMPTFINQVQIPLDQKIIDEGLKKYWDGMIILSIIFVLINIISCIGYYIFTKRNKYTGVTTTQV